VDFYQFGPAVKDKYGSDAESNVDDDEDSEDLETEDEDGDELTPGVDAAILRLLAKIKRKDPEIYEKDKPVFDGMVDVIIDLVFFHGS
jgi:protein KRI1